MDPFCYLCLVLSVPYNFVITCWERADLLALLCVMFPCVLSFSHMVSRVKCGSLIVSIPDLCILSYFDLGLYPNSTDSVFEWGESYKLLGFLDMLCLLTCQPIIKFNFLITMSIKRI